MLDVLLLTFWDRLSVFFDCLTLEDGYVGCLETVATNYQSAPFNIPKEHHFNQLDCSTVLYKLIARMMHHNRQLLAIQGWSQLHSNQKKDKNPDKALS